jgi:KipI family sensor histidine kinase inhibitor
MVGYTKTRFFLMGDRGLLLQFGEKICPEVNEKVRRMALAIHEERIEGIVETVPSYRSLLILYNPLVVSIEDLKRRLVGIEEALQHISIEERKLIRIPVAYGGAYGPDLSYVARYHQLSSEEVIRLHCSRLYLIYMIGFIPGFPYMGELPEVLVTPRLKTPRLSVPAGSVGIAQSQTGIYPIESPGGWQIVGRTPVKLFVPEKEPPAVLRMGDLVQFYPIREDEFEDCVNKGNLCV